jgi:hypothetical protein
MIKNFSEEHATFVNYQSISSTLNMSEAASPVTAVAS